MEAETILTIVLIVLGIGLIIGAIQAQYQFNFTVVRDVDLNPVIIVYYNSYKHGIITREHIILYDKGRNKK